MLPRWVTSNAESVRAETEKSRLQTPAQRWAEVVSACEMLKLYWGLPGYPERIKAAADPVPESTVAALARLRAEFRRGRP